MQVYLLRCKKEQEITKKENPEVHATYLTRSDFVFKSSIKYEERAIF